MAKFLILEGSGYHDQGQSHLGQTGCAHLHTYPSSITLITCHQVYTTLHYTTQGLS